MTRSRGHRVIGLRLVVLVVLMLMVVIVSLMLLIVLLIVSVVAGLVGVVRGCDVCGEVLEVHPQGSNQRLLHI